jgi:hypothetical protein
MIRSHRQNLEDCLTPATLETAENTGKGDRVATVNTAGIIYGGHHPAYAGKMIAFCHGVAGVSPDYSILCKRETG